MGNPMHIVPVDGDRGPGPGPDPDRVPGADRLNGFLTLASIAWSCDELDRPARHETGTWREKIKLRPSQSSFRAKNDRGTETVRAP